MKLSVWGEYVMRALLMLTMHHGEDFVRIQTISEK
jgi:DNA-binding IscR family transcriptional regulator